MGKTDIRDPGRVAADHPGVAYQAFDLGWADPDRIAQILAQVTALLGGRQAAPCRRCGAGTCGGRRRRSGS